MKYIEIYICIITFFFFFKYFFFIFFSPFLKENDNIGMTNNKKKMLVFMINL